MSQHVSKGRKDCLPEADHNENKIPIHALAKCLEDIFLNLTWR